MSSASWLIQLEPLIVSMRHYPSLSFRTNIICAGLIAPSLAYGTDIKYKPCPLLSWGLVSYQSSCSNTVLESWSGVCRIFTTVHSALVSQPVSLSSAKGAFTLEVVLPVSSFARGELVLSLYHQVKTIWAESPKSLSPGENPVGRISSWTSILRKRRFTFKVTWASLGRIYWLTYLLEY